MRQNHAIELTKDPVEVFEDYTVALKNINLAYPKVDTKLAIDGWVTNDTAYYSENDISNAKQLLQTDSFRATLKTMRTNFSYSIAKSNNRYGDGMSIIKLIKNYYPDVKLLF